MGRGPCAHLGTAALAQGGKGGVHALASLTRSEEYVGA